MGRPVRGPKFVQFFDPVLKALKQLGDSARPGEVVEAVAKIKDIPDEQRQETLQSGRPRFDNQVAFARQYLVWGGYLDSSERGVWRLTDKGRKCPGWTDAEAVALFKKLHTEHASPGRQANTPDDGEDDDTETPEPTDIYKQQHLGILRQLPPDGFERLCQYLFRVSGFEEVKVTGRSGDGGIDGHGIVSANPFVTFKVLFQCKRYAGAVGAGEVRDFRGAMQGRSDKGVILTTGTFTREAHKEAIREGVPTIELVDGEKLVGMLKDNGLGIKSRMIYEVDSSFFEQYR